MPPGPAGRVAAPAPRLPAAGREEGQERPERRGLGAGPEVPGLPGLERQPGREEELGTRARTGGAGTTGRSAAEPGERELPDRL